MGSNQKIIGLIALLGLMACDHQTPSLPPPELDSRLERLFHTSCALCHAASGSGAPPVGDPDWDQRWAQGFDALMQHTIEGMEGMPPLGYCATCSKEDFKILIQFLAQKGLPREKAGERNQLP